MVGTVRELFLGKRREGYRLAFLPHASPCPHDFTCYVVGLSLVPSFSVGYCLSAFWGLSTEQISGYIQDLQRSVVK